jgi:glycosyltransferase involved in cell wall biosynthesis/SAM-dependent methyltransferase
MADPEVSDPLFRWRADAPASPAGEAPELSVVIPVHNEEGNTIPLCEHLEAVLDTLGLRSEVIVIDDGSTDGTPSEIERLRASHPRLKTIRLRRRFQKSAAYMAGFKHARGRIVVTMDGDGQDDPADLPRLLAPLGEGFDMVSGWKIAGKGPWTKRVPSRLFNIVTAALTRIPLHDFNCPFKAYRREVIEDLQLYGELHRFIPVLAHERGYRFCEVPVTNLARVRGRSKYGAGRFLRGFFDLLTILFLTRYTRKPLHFFGICGAGIFLMGFGFAFYLLLLKILTGLPFSASFPLLLFSILLMVLGFQTFSLGLLSDLLVQRRSERADYSIESIRGGQGADPLAGAPPQAGGHDAVRAGGQEDLFGRLRRLRQAAPAAIDATWRGKLPPSKYRSRNPLRRYLVSRFLQAVSTRLGSVEPSRVLEVGCGEGHLLARLGGGKNCRIIGLDRSRDVLRLARLRVPDIPLVCADARFVPFRAESLDAVCCFEVLEHLDTPDLALAELARICHGHLILSVPWEPFFRVSNLLVGTHPSRLGSDPGHRQAWSRAGFARFLRGKMQVDCHRIQYPWQIVLGRPNARVS